MVRLVPLICKNFKYIQSSFPYVAISTQRSMLCLVGILPVFCIACHYCSLKKLTCIMARREKCYSQRNPELIVVCNKIQSKSGIDFWGVGGVII